MISDYLHQTFPYWLSNMSSIFPFVNKVVTVTNYTYCMSREPEIKTGQSSSINYKHANRSTRCSLSIFFMLYSKRHGIVIAVLNHIYTQKQDLFVEGFPLALRPSGPIPGLSLHKCPSLVVPSDCRVKAPKSSHCRIAAENAVGDILFQVHRKGMPSVS